MATGPGRRWVPMMYLVTDPAEQSDCDRIRVVPPALMVMERRYQYRLIWDYERQAWRVDYRSDARTGGAD